MNIQTVAQNLRNTIAGKEMLLAEYESKNILLAGMLRVNIDELKRILQDLEKCVEKETYNSWKENPDRQGGGGWTAEELDPNRGWK